MGWQEDYRAKFITAEQAANLVKSGDQVMFTAGKEAHAVGLAIAARLGELKHVKIMAPSPGYDFGWYDSGWDESFEITVGWPTAVAQQAIDERRCDVLLPDLIPMRELGARYSGGIVLTEISTPDDKGFCSFGQALWDKKRQVRNARLVIAEVNKNLIRTCGDNFVHVSEIDFFVEHTSTGFGGRGTLAGRAVKAPEPYLRDIVANVSELIPDGATIQIGVGRVTEHIANLGLFSNKQDIGFYSEATPPGIISLIREGVINGSRKTVHKGKAICTSLGGGTKEEMDWAAENPLIELVDVVDLEDVRHIAAHDNMFAINQALAIDLTGQATAESLGPKITSIAGGQTVFAIGSLFSKGGHAVTILPSTAMGGKVSRIMPLLPEGTVVTIPRNIIDCVVTEYGIARLSGKTLRERTQELISIAHPDFRSELAKRARELYWP